VIRYEFNEANRLLRETSPEGVTDYRYDSNGNQTLKVEPDGTEWSYIFDIENRLVGVSGPNDAKYRYDALGRRILRYAGWNDSSVQERYFYRRKGNKFFSFSEQ